MNQTQCHPLSPFVPQTPAELDLSLNCLKRTGWLERVGAHLLPS